MVRSKREFKIMEKVVLTIAGSDPSGGAGVQADLKTFADFCVTGLSAITAITAQNEKELTAIYPTPADILSQQLSTASKGKIISAVKIGMVATMANIKTIIWYLSHTETPNIVIDPVFYSSSGVALLEDTEAYTFFRQHLLPLAAVITPNLSEASGLAGMKVASLSAMHKAADAIHQDMMKMRGSYSRPLAVIIKGGHLEGDAIDVAFDGDKHYLFKSKKIDVPSPRGTGCRFSSAIAACLANGDDLYNAVEKAKKYVEDYIKSSRI